VGGPWNIFDPDGGPSGLKKKAGEKIKSFDMGRKERGGALFCISRVYI